MSIFTMSASRQAPNAFTIGTSTAVVWPISAIFDSDRWLAAKRAMPSRWSRRADGAPPIREPVGRDGSIKQVGVGGIQLERDHSS